MMMASSICLNHAPEVVYRTAETSIKKDNPMSQASAAASGVPSVSWPSNGLSMQTLYGLATSLCIGDQELTPVQAWFELASLYPADVLLSLPVLNALKREFLGVVKCMWFGAVIERGAFESVVGRVLGSAGVVGEGIS
jgi:hypothetical protein